MLSKFTLFTIVSFVLHKQCEAADHVLPGLASRNILQDRSPVSPLQKRDDCGDGSSCMIGDCCGTGCAPNCCALDGKGEGCGMGEKCSFEGNVFVGCCPLGAIGGCTGEATRITINTPYSTVTFGSETTADAKANPTADPTAPDSPSSPGGANPTKPPMPTGDPASPDSPKPASPDSPDPDSPESPTGMGSSLIASGMDRLGALSLVLAAALAL